MVCHIIDKSSINYYMMCLWGLVETTCNGEKRFPRYSTGFHVLILCSPKGGMYQHSAVNCLIYCKFLSNGEFIQMISGMKY